MCTNDKTQLRALFDSIELWEKRFAAKDTEELAPFEALSCPLCLVNIQKDTGTGCIIDCSSCIIAIETGKTGCAATPYYDATVAKTMWQITENNESLASRMIYRSMWRVEAMKMIKLLKSLVPRDAWLA